MYSERLFAKKCSVELPEQEYDEGIGISVWLNKLSRCKFKRGAANPFWVSWKAVEACVMVWCCILFCCMVNGNGLCWTLAWRGITLVVWYSRVWYGYMVCWSLWAGEDNARQPESFGGKFAPGCRARLLVGEYCTVLYMQPPTAVCLDDTRRDGRTSAFEIIFQI